MQSPRLASRTPRAPRRRILRTRLALLYGGLILACGAALLAFADLLVVGLDSPSHLTSSRARHPLPLGQLRASPPSGTDLHQVLICSALALLVVALAGAPLGWMMAGRALRPLRAMLATAREISATNLHARLDLSGPYEEFVELGDTLDDLFGRLEASFESQRHFVANASHELRTPLAAERALLQVALTDPKPTIAALRATCEELLTLGAQEGRLVDALLTLASSERGIQRWATVDLAAVTEKVVQDRRHDAGRRRIHVALAAHAADTAGDANLIESLVANLVDNTLRHNVPNGRVEIATTMSAGQATLFLANTGPTIHPGEVDRLVQPFQRLGHERTGDRQGHGLGLAIVAAIADAHHAELAVQARPGGGLAVKVSFAPAQDAR